MDDPPQAFWGDLLPGIGATDEDNERRADSVGDVHRAGVDGDECRALCAERTELSECEG